jgi:glycine hydroxymethyltransferase
VSREELLQSLDRQRRFFADSIVLTPVDSLPFTLADREHTDFLHGLYLTDKVRDRARRQAALVLFAGREAAALDIAEIHHLLADAFGGAEGSLRLLSGLQAHAATFMSISSAGQTVMLLSEEAGGHFSTHAILRRLGLRVVDMAIDYERLCIDRAATLELVDRERPDFIFVDRSEGLRYEDFSFIGSIAGITKVFDASQYVTPLITGRYQNPLAWGFDLMLFTLHKSFPGPQKAGVVTREPGELWKRLVTGLGTIVSSSHAENTYLAALALLRREWLERYAARLFATAGELEQQLARRGVPVVERAVQGLPEWPPTHHLWIRALDDGDAFAKYERLARANIQTNYRKLPYGLGYGLRLGTTFSSVAGIDVGHVEELADIIAAALAEQPAGPLRARVRALAVSARAGAIVPPQHWA